MGIFFNQTISDLCEVCSDDKCIYIRIPLIGYIYSVVFVFNLVPLWLLQAEVAVRSMHYAVSPDHGVATAYPHRYSNLQGWG